MNDPTLIGSEPLSPDQLRETLASLAARRTRPKFWRSADELEADFTAPVTASVPAEATPVARRDFIKVMGASAAMTGIAACTKQPKELIVPYVDAPEEIIPGRPLYFATCFEYGGASVGLLAESHMGRPTKLEGNPLHPGSLGGTDIITQAAILNLWDPDRSQAVLNRGRQSDWSTFTKEVVPALEASGGKGARVLVSRTTSPFLNARLDAFLAAYPAAKVHYHDVVGDDNARAGSIIALGDVFSSVYDFSTANVVLSLDADILHSLPGHERYARDFAARRKVADGVKEMNRLYVVENNVSITGSAADARFATKTSRIAQVAREVAHILGLDVGGPVVLSDAEKQFAALVAADLQAAGSKGIVVVGESQPPEIHALAHAIHAKLASSSVRLIPSIVLGAPNAAQSLHDLVADMEKGDVSLLVMLDVNPVYDAGGDVDFAAAMSKVATCVHLGVVVDETAAESHWHIPAATFLEYWGDGRAYDGTACIQQPLIQPLYQSRSAADVLAALQGQPGASMHDALKEFWASRAPADAGDFEKYWRRSLHDGVLAGSAPAAANPPVNPSVAAFSSRVASGGAGEFEIAIRPCTNIFDGRFANNAWLQEAPRHVTTLAWDNAALMSLATAKELGLTKRMPNREKTIPVSDTAIIELGGRSIEIAYLIVPGHAEGSITIALGYGHQVGGRHALGTGKSVFPLRTKESRWIGRGIAVSKGKNPYSIALLQDHYSMENRALYRADTLEQHKEDPYYIQGQSHTWKPKYTLHGNDFEHIYAKGPQWGMVIDLGSCTGCNACVVACQAENNISTVGKKDCLNGREMHWIRVDRYFPSDTPDYQTGAVFQPVPCMQCEKAPCEVVCPVGATVHSNDGLNVMVYNRCVGTRYCSNNCPFKVRRYNYYKYTDDKSESLKFQRNPDVTVRLRGVMEKCTYCVQRINHARIDARNANRPIRDGDVVTACQQACPSAAIAFGDIRDPESRVSKLKKAQLNYTLLDELNVRPRTSYLGRITNPNFAWTPRVEHPAGHHGHGHDDHGDDGHKKNDHGRINSSEGNHAQRGAHA